MSKSNCVEAKKVLESLFSKDVLSDYSSLKKSLQLMPGVLEDVVKLSFLLVEKIPVEKMTLPLIQNEMDLISKDDKYSPLAKHFVLQHLSKCSNKYFNSSEKLSQAIAKDVYALALKDQRLLHLDFQEYQKNMAQNFEEKDRIFFMNFCQVTERLVSTDSKKTLFKSPDERIRLIEEDLSLKLSDAVKSEIKKNLFFFKQERVHLSHQKTDIKSESYALMKKMCQKSFIDMAQKVRKCSKKQRSRVSSTKMRENS